MTVYEGYGDGSPEQIKKFVDSVRSTEVSDEFIDARSFEILPKKFKKSLKIKGRLLEISMYLMIKHTTICIIWVG